MDYISLARKFLPKPVKGWIKSHHNVANILDALLYMKIREIKVHTDLETMLSFNEREYLFRLAASNNPEHAIVEIGCYEGGSSYFLGKGAEKSGSSVYTIDPFDSDLDRQAIECDGSDYLGKKPSIAEVQRNMRRHNLQETVELIEGRSLDIASIWNHPIGIMFIDGNHKFAYEDYTAWRKHLAEKSVVAFHDSNPNYKHSRQDVSRAVEKIMWENHFAKVERFDSITALFT